MENPIFLARDAFTFLGQAEAVVMKAVSECRAMTPEEAARVDELRSTAAPMLQRAVEIREALKAQR